MTSHQLQPVGQPPAPATCYVEAASVIDAMFDQLDYLVDHQSVDCPPECADCARLAQVRQCLLSPFGIH